MHEGTLRREGTVLELTQTLPSVITFALPPGAPEPPIVGALNGAFHVETFNLQADLHRLLGWAHDSRRRAARTWKPGPPASTTSSAPSAASDPDHPSPRKEARSCW